MKVFLAMSLVIAASAMTPACELIHPTNLDHVEIQRLIYKKEISQILL